MSKKESFIKMVQDLIEQSIAELPEDGLVYFEALKESKSAEKPAFTDNGKLIMLHMKEKFEEVNNLFKAKDIAEGIFVSSRSVSGAIRKLVTDGYVEKVGQDPIIYSLTALGKEVEISVEYVFDKLRKI